MKAHDIRETMAGEPSFAEQDESGKAAFWMAGEFGGGVLWTGEWSGASPWERHPDSVEFLRTLEGSSTLTLLAQDGPREAEDARA